MARKRRRVQALRRASPEDLAAVYDLRVGT
jgi:hypothetical protein